MLSIIWSIRPTLFFSSLDLMNILQSTNEKASKAWIAFIIVWSSHDWMSYCLVRRLPMRLMDMSALMLLLCALKLHFNRRVAPLFYSYPFFLIRQCYGPWSRKSRCLQVLGKDVTQPPRLSFFGFCFFKIAPSAKVHMINAYTKKFKVPPVFFFSFGKRSELNTLFSFIFSGFLVWFFVASWC